MAAFRPHVGRPEAQHVAGSSSSEARRGNRRRGALKTSDLAASSAPTGSAIRDESPVESPRQLELPLLRWHPKCLLLKSYRNSIEYSIEV